MARPERHDADYFPFYAKRGRTLNILQSKFGLEGIGFFTNLMRFLTLTPDHHYCIRDEIDRMNFFAEIGVKDEAVGIEMIELMVKTEKLDKELWKNHQVIASSAFLASIEHAYEKRKNKVITIDEIRNYYNNLTVCEFPGEETGENMLSAEFPVENDIINAQTKQKDTKQKDTKQNSTISSLEVSELSFLQKSKKIKKHPLREREPFNDFECVEKVYLQNWDMLYSQKRVETPDPIVIWSQTRKLLKTHFEKLKPEQIVKAINNGLKDDFIMKNGYSLKIMLSAVVLNRLINTAAEPPPLNLNDKKSLGGLKSW